MSGGVIAQLGGLGRSGKGLIIGLKGSSCRAVFRGPRSLTRGSVTEYSVPGLKNGKSPEGYVACVIKGDLFSPCS